jgi:hypothetical protein
MMGYNKLIEHAINNLVAERFSYLPSYFSGSNFAKEINTETLIIHDEKDNIIPFSDALLYEHNFENSQLISTSGFGHSLRQNEVVEHVLEFIKIEKSVLLPYE